jgi:predicted HTH transcriptional regulator
LYLKHSSFIIYHSSLATAILSVDLQKYLQKWQNGFFLEIVQNPFTFAQKNLKKMDALIDLKELSIRESERVEWKEKGDDIQIVKSIVKTIAAFANDISNLGGGYVVCGAKEVKDEYGFPQIDYSGLTASELKEIEGKVIQHCRDYVNPAVLPRVQELENPMDRSTRILVFVVPATAEAHVYRDGTTTNYYVRISRETHDASIDIVNQLLIKKGKIEYFDKRVNLNASTSDMDEFGFREILQEMNLLIPERPLEIYFSDKEQITAFIPPLFAKTRIDGIWRPKNFALLLFGKTTSITRWYTDAFIIVSVYNGTDRYEPTIERYELIGSIVTQAKQAIALLNKQVCATIDKNNSKPNTVKYPIRALHEAVLNAIVHRDYAIPEPIRITIFTDRIEIRSPGCLYSSSEKETFVKGKASARWRNPSFASVFNKLQLTKSEGQGIPAILKTMRTEGCPAPIFEMESEYVTCILCAHPRYQMIREQQEIQDKIILGKYEEAKKQLIPLLNKDLYNAKNLDLYCDLTDKMNQPEILFHFLTTQIIAFQEINSNTLMQMAAVLQKGTPLHRKLVKETLRPNYMRRI